MQGAVAVFIQAENPVGQGGVWDVTREAELCGDRLLLRRENGGGTEVGFKNGILPPADGREAHQPRRCHVPRKRECPVGLSLLKVDVAPPIARDVHAAEVERQQAAFGLEHVAAEPAKIGSRVVWETAGLRVVRRDGDDEGGTVKPRQGLPAQGARRPRCRPLLAKFPRAVRPVPEGGRFRRPHL